LGNLGLFFRAVGCIFGDLLNNSPLFPVSVIFFYISFDISKLFPAPYWLTHFWYLFQGENDIEQLCCVLRVLGTPDEASWPVCTFYPEAGYSKLYSRLNLS
jgi:cell cycle related kinase